jgi:threonine dehydrogenase-like Zn-dependent dehydrogenase
VYRGPRNIRVEDVPDAVLREPTDVVVRVNPDRLAIARRFGATNCVEERGDAALERVRELTGGGAT